MTDSQKNIFVFVVCGSKVHIDTLNFSLRHLLNFSKLPVWIVTDSGRNETPIEYNHIIDVKTPEDFDNHQASIYLKTGLHKILDLKNNYCYLDSDVIALSPQVDQIFQHQYGPITFAPDHCKIASFSPSAINCGCLEKKENELQDFISVVKKYIPDYEHDMIFHTAQGRDLYRILAEIENKPFKHRRLIINYLIERYLLKHTRWHPNWGGKLKYSSRKQGWIDMDGNIIMYNLTSISEQIKSDSDFYYDKTKMMWVNKNGEAIFSCTCSHLIEKIKSKFNIEINKPDFQHWNGGVFLFNKKSFDFLEAWHQKTMTIFKDSEWKTRDQGTLAATVWQFGLQNQKTLPEQFNFIADYYNPNIRFVDEKGFTKDNFKTSISPNFIHVYHEFGNQNWDIWKAIESILKKNGTKKNIFNH